MEKGRRIEIGVRSQDEGVPEEEKSRQADKQAMGVGERPKARRGNLRSERARFSDQAKKEGGGNRQQQY